MQRTTRKIARFARGMAVGMILLACLLLAAISMAMTFAAKSGLGTSDTNMNQVLASTILDQASAYSAAFNTFYTKTGCYPVWLALDTTMTITDCNLYYPGNGTISPQTPPIAAFTSPANAHWVYKTDMTDGYDYGYPDVALMNVGTGNDSYVMVLAGLTQGVCQQINQKLLGTTTINAPTTPNNLSDWSKQTVFIDLSTDNAVNGLYAQCIKTTDGGYVFYNVTWAQ